MNTFTLLSGRKVNKPAEFCVATKANGRWHHRYFKTYRGAHNEFKMQSAHLKNDDMVASYGLEAVRVIRPD